MSNQVSLDMVSRGKEVFCYTKELIQFFMRKPPFIRTWRIYHFPSFLFIGFVSTRLACRRRKKHVSCCKSMCMWKYLLLLSGAYCLEAVRPSCNLHYRQTAKKILKQNFFWIWKICQAVYFFAVDDWPVEEVMHLPNLPIFVVPFTKLFTQKLGR